MKKIIITFLTLLFASPLYSQSSIIYETGTNLLVETGADVCADTIYINGTWSGGGTLCDGPLPVELISFTSSVSAEGRDVKLSWKIGKEINNSGFDIERKLVGINEWKKISFVTGKGNSNTPVQYSYDDKKLNCGKYNYRLKQIDFNGIFKYYTLNEAVEVAAPIKFNLNQNYPNPFNPNTKIDFELPIDCKVTIKVYDITGREIILLLNNEFKKADYYTVDFNGNNFASGVYFYRLVTEGFTETKKMLLIK